MTAGVQTEVIRVDAACPQARLLLPAAEALRHGELVAFPTETVYGLGGDALNGQAVSRIFQVKGRPPDNPLIVHGANLGSLEPLLAHIPPLARLLLEKLSPGPLTLVLRRSSRVPDLVTAGLDTVAVRIPDHPVALRLLQLAEVAVAAPSANRSGKPSPTQAWHVLQDLDGRIPYLVDGGPCRYGLESTVVDLTGTQPVILRPGSITAGMITQLTGIEVRLAAGADETGSPAGEQAPRAPGMKYRHYAPRAALYILDLSGKDDLSSSHVRVLAGKNLTAQIASWQAQGRRVGLFASEATLSQLPIAHAAAWCGENARPPACPGSSQPAVCCSFAYGPVPDAAEAGRMLFDALRVLDGHHCDIIVAEALPEAGVGSAYMNRLRKASSPAEKDPTGARENHEQ